MKRNWLIQLPVNAAIYTKRDDQSLFQKLEDADRLATRRDKVATNYGDPHPYHVNPYVRMCVLLGTPFNSGLFRYQDELIRARTAPIDKHSNEDKRRAVSSHTVR